jgi:hypothetical protein
VLLAFEGGAQLSTDIRQIPGDFEARIALLAGSGNGKLPRRRQEAIEAGS